LFVRGHVTEPMMSIYYYSLNFQMLFQDFINIIRNKSKNAYNFMSINLLKLAEIF